MLLRVTGRASHAGEAPEEGRNALYELAHQIMQMRDLSDPREGIKMNWTVASAGTVRNHIPASAQATADVRVQRVASWDVIERRVRERVKKTLVPDTKVEVVVERRRPPLEATDASRRLAAHAQTIYAAAGRKLRIGTEGSGGATDAALAALETRAPVIEGLGLLGDGRSLERRRIHLSQLHRAAPLPPVPADHGRRGGQELNPRRPTAETKGEHPSCPTTPRMAGLQTRLCLRRLLLVAPGDALASRGPLGEREKVAALLKELLPRLTFDAEWTGTFTRSGQELRLQLAGDPVLAIELLLPQDGAALMPPIERVAAKTGWRLIDPDRPEPADGRDCGGASRPGTAVGRPRGDRSGRRRIHGVGDEGIERLPDRHER